MIKGWLKVDLWLDLEDGIGCPTGKERSPLVMDLVLK